MYDGIMNQESVKIKKKKVLGKPNIISRAEYKGLEMETKLELIYQLIPLLTSRGQTFHQKRTLFA